MRALVGIALVLLVVAAAKLIPGVADPVTGRDLDSYEIRPGDGIGPVRIGMSRAEAWRAMTVSDRAVRSIDRGGPRSALAMHDNAFQVYFDAADRVQAVEVMRPTGGALRPGEELPFDARLGDVDVFRTTATQLVDVVSRTAKPDPNGEDPGVTFEYPAIGLVLWREGREDTPYFQTVYVSRAKR